jgi:hypothetical protein
MNLPIGSGAPPPVPPKPDSITRNLANKQYSTPSSSVKPPLHSYDQNSSFLLQQRDKGRKKIGDTTDKELTLEEQMTKLQGKYDKYKDLKGPEARKERDKIAEQMRSLLANAPPDVAAMRPEGLKPPPPPGPAPTSAKIKKTEYKIQSKFSLAAIANWAQRKGLTF